MIKQRLILQPQQLAQIQIATLIPILITLTLEQQNYLYKVLRLKAGGEFIALNGQGNWWRAVLANNVGQVEILEQIPTTPNLKTDITLAIAMPKGNGMESVIRQATELGVSKIIPMWSDRTVIRPHTNLGTVKLERWLKIAQEISEQSCRAYVPEICEPQTFADALHRFCNFDSSNFGSNNFGSNNFGSNNFDSEAQINKYICVTTKPHPHLLNFVMNLSLTPSKIVILTGAEGGWSDSETALAISHGFQPVSLGDRILAAVTAPVVALSIIIAVIESN